MSASYFFLAKEAGCAVLLGEQCPLFRYDRGAMADERHVPPPLGPSRPPSM